jgi:hypothetical protein
MSLGFWRLAVFVRGELPERTLVHDYSNLGKVVGPKARQ